MKKNFFLLFKRVVLTLALLGAATALTEGAFQLRDWRNRALLSNPVLEGKQTVLTIGDSVLGIGPDAPVVRWLEATLQEAHKDAYVVKNLSTPGNSSITVLQRVDSYIEKFHPRYAVLLLGKGDKNTELLSDSLEPKQKSMRWLRQLKLFQLVEMATVHLKNIYENTGLFFRNFSSMQSPPVPKDLRRQIVDLRYGPDLSSGKKKIEELTSAPLDAKARAKDSYYLACFAYALLADAKPEALGQASKCIQDMELKNVPEWYLAVLKSQLATSLVEIGQHQQAEKLFYEALAIDPIYAHAWIGLAWLALPQKDGCEKAIPFFENGLRTSIRAEARACHYLYTCYRDQKMFDQGEQFFSELEKSSDSVVCGRFLARGLKADQAKTYKLQQTFSVPTTRNEYLTKLWYYRREHDEKKAASLFRKVSLYASKDTEVLNTKLFSEILARLAKGGAKIVILQYPNEPNGNLDELAKSLGPQFHFLSLQSVLSKELEHASLFDLLESDGEHLTPRGAELAGKAIAESLLSFDDGTSQ